ncbi:hypothetical protein [Bartonella doshiae]|uniref:hypothetical protein n=1 Tax=Bartonella doshiae TaxID=33044 RepID=UPI000943353F|nr:hypothetical protein [Bartonella doshiae]
MSTKHGASAFGHRAYATSRKSLSIEFYSRAKVETGVALGAHSIVYISKGIVGYSPLLQYIKESEKPQWKSTLGTVSMNDFSEQKNRQIVGVASGRNFSVDC